MDLVSVRPVVVSAKPAVALDSPLVMDLLPATDSLLAMDSPRVMD